MSVRVGYHGTLKRKAKTILYEKHFIPSKKDTEWLGTGIYFFEYLAHAWRWADNQCNRKNARQEDTAAVLKAEICVEQDNVLDFDNPNTKAELDQFFCKVLEHSNEKREMLSNAENAEYLRRSLACNLFCEANSNIQLIIYTFHKCIKRENREKEVYCETERQLCVKDASVIASIKEVDRDGKEIH